MSGMKDITEIWAGAKNGEAAVVEKREYTVHGVTYKLDGKHIVLRPTEQERSIAVMLSMKYGKTVELVPQIMFPQGVQTPDYLIDGERFDLKTPTGAGKDVFRDLIKKKKKQSPNFIFDISK